MNKYRFQASSTPGFWTIEEQNGTRVPGTITKRNTDTANEGLVAELIMKRDDAKAAQFRKKGAIVDAAKEVMAVRFYQPTVASMSSMIDHFVNGVPA